MNSVKLKGWEKAFLKTYPKGFNHPEMIELGKKHKMSKLIEFAQDSFKKSEFSDHEEIMNSYVKMVTRSSMVSIFEKPKFRDFVKSLGFEQKKKISLALKAILHGNEEKGFAKLVDELRPFKLAKWTLVSVVQAYYNPDEDVFIKPTTAKGVIQHLELKGLEYKPAPSYEFYFAYRQQVTKMKKKVSKSLAPNNAAFCGFLMMSFQS